MLKNKQKIHKIKEKSLLFQLVEIEDRLRLKTEEKKEVDNRLKWQWVGNNSD